MLVVTAVASGAGYMGRAAGNYSWVICIYHAHIHKAAGCCDEQGGNTSKLTIE